MNDQLITYLRNAVEHDRQQKVGAVGLLRSFSLILEERELALDTVPDGHLVDEVQEDEGVKDDHEPLHAVNGRQEHLLKVLRGFWCLGQHNALRLVIEREGHDEGYEGE